MEQCQMNKESCGAVEARVLELVAIGASIGSGCDEWLDYHLKAAREAGATTAEISSAMKMAQKVRQVQVRTAEKFGRRIDGLVAELSGK